MHQTRQPMFGSVKLNSVLTRESSGSSSQEDLSVSEPRNTRIHQQTSAQQINDHRLNGVQSLQSSSAFVSEFLTVGWCPLRYAVQDSDVTWWQTFCSLYHNQ
ncbi:hypothetical protein BaRGS_00032066 [Batillaria attramentaria]|uniref:Uncharacterized protein n=1 Tax=Batillaria attramentaria TaxID=370345 RepID=A0ABD0JPQ0_9CAEN